MHIDTEDLHGHSPKASQNHLPMQPDLFKAPRRGLEKILFIFKRFRDVLSKGPISKSCDVVVCWKIQTYSERCGMLTKNKHALTISRRA
jgi:hypothetical protein